MQRSHSMRDRFVSLALAVILGASMMPAVPVSAGDALFRFPWGGRAEEETQETQPAQSQSRKDDLEKPSETKNTPSFSDREKGFITAGGAFMAELDGQVWLTDRNGVFAEKDGVETVRYPGQYDGICSAFGRIYLIRDDSEDAEAEWRDYSLVMLDPEKGDLVSVYRFSQTYEEPWFIGAAKGSLFIYHRGSVLALDETGTIRPTPYQQTEYISEHGVYVPETVENGSFSGLLYVPDEKPFQGIVFPELTQKFVRTWFTYKDRLYLAADDKIAWIELDSEDPTVHFLPIQFPLQEEEIVFVNCNYGESPLLTLYMAVGTRGEGGDDGKVRIHLYQWKAIGNQLRELDVFDCPLPLCWVSIIGNVLYTYTLFDR